MTNEYFIFYALASVVCVLSLIVMLINDNQFGIHQEKQICLNRAIIAFILYFVSDAVWAAVLSGNLPAWRWLSCLIYLSNYVLMGLLGYMWFMYMAAAERMPFRESRKKRLLSALPLVCSVLLILALYVLDPYFWISETGELNSLYNPLQIAVPVLYLIVAFILSVINARKAETTDDKRLFRLIGILPIGVLACGLFQPLFLNLPTFCFGCTLMLLYFYVQNMLALISVDELTRLNNRRQINRFMEQISYRENAKVFVMMIDIDRFKQINDNYGHAEGDRALILFSAALKQACGALKCRVFIGRYGGDEFVVILQGRSRSPPASATY